MWNDMTFQIKLLNAFDHDEVKAFRWLFIPIYTLGNRTPIEMIAEGGHEAVNEILQKFNSGLE